MRSLRDVLARALLSAPLVGCGGGVVGSDDGGTDRGDSSTDQIEDDSSIIDPFDAATVKDAELDTANCKFMRIPNDAKCNFSVQTNGYCMGVSCDTFCGTDGLGYNCSFTQNDIVDCTCRPLPGRGTAGIERHGPGAGLGALFAWMAWGEAASVHAFGRLARELASHGAPDELVRGARRARSDEQRHARVMRTIARRHHARPMVARPPVAMKARSLTRVAIENAAEACVGETWSALLCAHQARACPDAEVRGALADIAEDELRHAELAWEIRTWTMTKLRARDRRRMNDALATAVRALRASIESSPVPAGSGLPSKQLARAMFEVMVDDLWSL